MTKRLVLTAFAILGIAGTAAAAPIALPTNEPVYGQFNNLEQVNLANNLTVPGYAPAAGLLQGNWGVINVSTLQHGGVVSPNIDIGGGSPFFVDGGVGGNQITGIFYGVQNLSPTTSTGGTLDLFWHDAGTIDASCLAGATCAPDAATVARFTSGTFLARIDFANGISVNPLVFTSSSTDVTTPGGSGRSDAFANVNLATVGPWTSALNGNWFTLPGQPVPPGFTPRDIRFSTFFNVDVASWAVGPAGTVGLRSNDPVRVFTTAAVPEPATLTLLGLGIAGLGYRRRRQNKA